MRELTILCVLGLATSPAFADAETMLLLRDGTTFEGHVLRMEQGRRVVLRLDADGTVRIVPWEQIEDITGAAARAVPKVDEWEPPARPLPQPGWVPLTIEADGDPVSVGPSLSPSSARARMQTMCSTPCTYYVIPGTASVQTSNGDRALKLDVPPAGLDVKIHPASSGEMLLGMTMWMLGGPLVIGSAFYMPRRGDLKGGAAMLGIGAPLTAAGITLSVLGRPRVLSQRKHAPPLSFSVAPASEGALAITQGRF